MLKDLESYIGQCGLFGRRHRLLLAVSGGADSTVLAHLLRGAGYNFSMAHCNFGLRGEASAGDEAFCRELAAGLGTEIFVKQFDVAACRRQTGLSIQMAARKLRYDWFTELMTVYRFDFLLTAHHAGDLVETVFLNLLRGTGVKGMKGMAIRHGRIIRPLLPFTREAIHSYAETHHIAYREDESNNDDKYGRNFIRLHVIPALRKLNPQLEETFIRNSEHFEQEAAIVQQFIADRQQEICTVEAGLLTIDKKKLAATPYAETVLHGILGPYGFNRTQQRNILENIRCAEPPGQLYYSAGHEITVDRERLILRTKPVIVDEPATISDINELKQYGLQVEEPAVFKRPRTGELYVRRASLVFPLVWRSRRRGDKFRPFGMSGFKLVSDLMKEQKLNAFEKSSCRLLVNGNGDIIWVAGYRSDDRYKVEPGAGDLIKISLVEH